MLRRILFILTAVIMANCGDRLHNICGISDAVETFSIILPGGRLENFCLDRNGNRHGLYSIREHKDFYNYVALVIGQYHHGTQVGWWEDWRSSDGKEVRTWKGNIPLTNTASVGDIAGHP